MMSGGNNDRRTAHWIVKDEEMVIACSNRGHARLVVVLIHVALIVKRLSLSSLSSGFWIQSHCLRNHNTTLWTKANLTAPSLHPPIHQTCSATWVVSRPPMPPGVLF